MNTNTFVDVLWQQNQSVLTMGNPSVETPFTFPNGQTATLVIPSIATPLVDTGMSPRAIENHMFKIRANGLYYPINGTNSFTINLRASNTLGKTPLLQTPLSAGVSAYGQGGLWGIECHVIWSSLFQILTGWSQSWNGSTSPNAAVPFISITTISQLQFQVTAVIPNSPGSYIMLTDFAADLV